MQEEKVHTGLILNFPEPDHYVLGAVETLDRFPEPDINPSGNWSQWLREAEIQRQYGFDPQSCAVLHTLKAWIVLSRFHGFWDFPQDLSERYTGVMSGTTPAGTDPHVVAETTRKDAGALPEESMPWNEPEIDTWPEYYNRAQAYNNLAFAKKLLDRYELGHKWIWAFGEKLSKEEKTARLREALKVGTVCVSVSGRYRTRSGSYFKDPGERDTHWTFISHLEKNGARIANDSYEPVIKRFEADYDHDGAKGYFLKRKEEKVKNFWSVIWDTFANLNLWKTH